MCSKFTDNLSEGNTPEVIEEYLELKNGVMTCIAFNRRGTLLAAGCINGSCVIWDFETRGIAKVLKDVDCNAAITSVCWSKYGHHILVSTAEKELILWDVTGGVKIVQTTLKLTPFHAQLHPSSAIPSLCLVTPTYSAPLIINLNTGKSIVLLVSLSECGKDSDLHFSSCFNGHGDLVYLGNPQGEILIIDHNKIQIRAVVSIPGAAGIKNIVFSKNGRFLLTNSRDRVIRVYEKMLPLKDGLKALYEMGEMLSDLGGIEKLMKEIGAKSLVLLHEFQHSGSRPYWKVPCFSSNGEYIIGGFDGEGEHKIYIWDRIGNLVKILTGPKEGLINLSWHPVHPILVSLTLTGFVYIWAKDCTENWSAFFPDFKELNRVEEYVEREDEFDLVPETRKVTESDVNHDQEADIVTMDNNSLFSDLEMSDEELCFLPSIPRSDTPVNQDISSGDSQKLVVTLVSNQSDSWNSEEAGLDKQTSNHEVNVMEGTDDCHDSTATVKHGTRSKRERRPTEKLLELLDQTAKKAVKKMNWPNTATRNFIDS